MVFKQGFTVCDKVKVPGGKGSSSGLGSTLGYLRLAGSFGNGEDGGPLLLSTVITTKNVIHTTNTELLKHFKFVFYNELLQTKICETRLDRCQLQFFSLLLFWCNNKQ